MGLRTTYINDYFHAGNRNDKYESPTVRTEKTFNFQKAKA